MGVVCRSLRYIFVGNGFLDCMTGTRYASLHLLLINSRIPFSCSVQNPSTPGTPVPPSPNRRTAVILIIISCTTKGNCRAFSPRGGNTCRTSFRNDVYISFSPIVSLPCANASTKTKPNGLKPNNTKQDNSTPHHSTCKLPPPSSLPSSFPASKPKTSSLFLPHPSPLQTLKPRRPKLR